VVFADQPDVIGRGGSGNGFEEIVGDFAIEFDFT